MAIQKLRFLALRQGGQAVIGIDLDYTEFSSNRIGVVANGTIVKIEKLGSAGVLPPPLPGRTGASGA
jgi:uncharacterized protein YbjQ (UPF0145 family)